MHPPSNYHLIHQNNSMVKSSIKGNHLTFPRQYPKNCLKLTNFENHSFEKRIEVIVVSLHHPSYYLIQSYIWLIRMFIEIDQHHWILCLRLQQKAEHLKTILHLARR